MTTEWTKIYQCIYCGETADHIDHFMHHCCAECEQTTDWVYPDGPWGWNDDGTSKAPTPEERKLHVAWYQDNKEMRDDD